MLAAHDFIAGNYPRDRDHWRHLNHDALHGGEIVDNTTRLFVMNLYLPDPDVLAREIMEELKAALEQFAGIVEEMGSEGSYFRYPIRVTPLSPAPSGEVKI